MLWDMHLCVFDVRLSFENRVAVNGFQRNSITEGLSIEGAQERTKAAIAEKLVVVVAGENDLRSIGLPTHEFNLLDLQVDFNLFCCFCWILIFFLQSKYRRWAEDGIHTNPMSLCGNKVIESL